MLQVYEQIGQLSHQRHRVDSGESAPQGARCASHSHNSPSPGAVVKVNARAPNPCSSPSFGHAARVYGRLRAQGRFELARAVRCSSTRSVNLTPTSQALRVLQSVSSRDLGHRNYAHDGHRRGHAT